MSDNTVERWDIHTDGLDNYSMRREKHGEFVRFEDYERLDNKLKRLPADWETNSSLQTWFPITAMAIEDQQKEIAKLQADNKALREALEKIADGDDTAPELMRRIAVAAQGKTNE